MSSKSSGGEHDSTGLRAELKAEHTALAVRVARETREVGGASETTQQLLGKGSFGSPFLLVMPIIEQKDCDGDDEPHGCCGCDEGDDGAVRGQNGW